MELAEPRRDYGPPDLVALRASLSEERLERHGWRCGSQIDEDGIIDAVLARTGAPHRRFVEVAPGDGSVCNTRYLLEHRGWRGLWAEANPKRASAARRRFDRFIAGGRLVLRRGRVTRDIMDALVAGAGPAIDLLSIDVDGVDYDLWAAVTSRRPRLVVVEYNPLHPPPSTWRVAYRDDFVWRRDGDYGASLCALDALAREKGYRLVACSIGGVNAFFVRDDLLGAFPGPFEPGELFRPRHPRAAAWAARR